jgi:outer membrane cobalamin receptor
MAMHFRQVIGSAIAAGVVFAALSNLCVATEADSTPGDQSGALTETVVTARRQNETLEKVPVAVEALPTNLLNEEHVEQGI